MGLGAIGSFLSSALQDELIPFQDFNRVLSDDGKAVMALGTNDWSLFIVGAAVFNAIGAVRMDKVLKTVKPSFQNVSGANYGQISTKLPQSAVPPEGTGLIMASIEAFTNYMPVTKATKKQT